MAESFLFKNEVKPYISKHVLAHLDSTDPRPYYFSKLAYYVSIPLCLATFDSNLSLHYLLCGRLSIQLHAVVQPN